MDYYKQIFKRKSFHLFRETEQMTKEDINQLNAFIGSVKPLNPRLKRKLVATGCCMQIQQMTRWKNVSCEICVSC